MCSEVSGWPPRSWRPAARASAAAPPRPAAIRSTAQSTQGTSASALPIGKRRKLTSIPESGKTSAASSAAGRDSPSSRPSSQAPQPPTTTRSQGSRTKPSCSGSAANSRWSGKSGADWPLAQNGAPANWCGFQNGRRPARSSRRRWSSQGWIWKVTSRR